MRRRLILWLERKLEEMDNKAASRARIAGKPIPPGIIERRRRRQQP